jgi:hypothetical protein
MRSTNDHERISENKQLKNNYKILNHALSVRMKSPMHAIGSFGNWIRRLSSISHCGQRVGGTDICIIKSQFCGVRDEEIVYLNKYLNYVRHQEEMG